MLKILMIVGSLRRDSFNRQLAKEIERAVGDRAEVSHLDYADVPNMNQDIEYPAPEAVERVREAVQAADGLWFVTPEYNYEIPGALKNLLDWLSRPLVKSDWGGMTAATGKLAAISGAAGKDAAVEARGALRRLLETMNMKVVGEEGTGVALTLEAFETDRADFSGEDVRRLKRQADEFIEALELCWVRPVEVTAK